MTIGSNEQALKRPWPWLLAYTDRSAACFDVPSVGAGQGMMACVQARGQVGSGVGSSKKYAYKRTGAS